MKNFFFASLLAVLIVLTGATLRQNIAGIGTMPVPVPPNATAIGTMPVPVPPNAGN